jgi:oxygen-independent coproporphyrinogen-3 oxidase
MNRPYLGVGAGAHGYWGGVRCANVTRVADYIRRCGSHEPPGRTDPHRPAAAWTAEVGEDEASRDTLMLGLRLTQAGVSVEDYVRRHGAQAWARARIALDRLEKDGLVERTADGGRVRLTPRGRMLGNRVFAEFV